ncbi:MAG: SH3 domain-containing protein [Anaerolineales bacterium]
MNRLFHFSCLAVAALLMNLAACSLPTETPPCTREQLQAPIPVSPNGESAILDPTDPLILEWGYPTSPCHPDFFEAYVWTGPEPETPGMTGRVNYDNRSSPGRWHMPWGIPLQPGNTYYWRVYAGLETGPGSDVDGPSARGYFFTGPICAAGTEMQPVNLISPPDDITVAPDEEITFAWDDPTPCLVNGLFEISIADNPDFYGRYGIPILQTVYTTTPAEIGTEGLQNCTRYYWRIKTDPAGPAEEPFSETRTFFVQPEGILCPPGNLNPPSIPPIAIARLDLNCRLGPSPDYPIEDAFYAGEQAPIEGRSADGNWWLITSPGREARCWVWAEQVDVEGDLSGVEIVEAPPLVTLEPSLTETPSATTVNCSQYQDPQSCLANPACQWHAAPPNQLPAGYCENK